MIRLLSTDFDGTLAGGLPGDQCVPELASELRAVTASGALWTVNTGRSLVSALEGLERLGAPVRPDYILTSERHIYRPDGSGGWVDYGDWNEICRDHHDALFEKSGVFFEKIRSLAEDHEGVTVLENASGVPEGLVASDEELLDAFSEEMDRIHGRPEDFHYQRSNIYLRFCHRRYDKGSALAELGRLLDMPSAGILAIGDHQNDIAMLVGGVAAMVACPSNAHATVKETVQEAGGHISELEAGEGTAEGIRVYRTGKKKPPVSW